MLVVSTIGHPRRCGMFGYATPDHVVSQGKTGCFQTTHTRKDLCQHPFDPLSLCWTSELLFPALFLLAFASSLLGSRPPALKLSRCVKANILAKRDQIIQSIQPCRLKICFDFNRNEKLITKKESQLCPPSIVYVLRRVMVEKEVKHSLPFEPSVHRGVPSRIF